MFKSLFSRRRLLPPEQFQAQIMHEMQQLDHVSHVAISQNQEFGLSVQFVGSENDEPFTAFLENAYRHYCTPGLSHRERDDILKEWALSLSSLHSDAAITRAGLVPVVRHYGYTMGVAFDDVMALNEGALSPEDFTTRNDGQLMRPFAGDLVVMLAHDTPNAVSYVSQSDLDELGISASEAWEEAFANFARLDLPVFSEPVSDAGLFVMAFEEEAWITPSLLLATEHLSAFARDNGIETLLVALPQRAQLFLIDQQQEQAIDSLAECIMQFGQGDHPQSECIFQFDPAAQNFVLLGSITASESESTE